LPVLGPGGVNTKNVAFKTTHFIHS
jgi:hypothetical protein